MTPADIRQRIAAAVRTPRASKTDYGHPDLMFVGIPRSLIDELHTATDTEPATPAVVLIPGWTPKEDERFDIRLSCRVCLRASRGVDITAKSCETLPSTEDLAAMQCPMGPHDSPEWNVETRWVGAWDDLSATDDDDDIDDPFEGEAGW